MPWLVNEEDNDLLVYVWDIAGMSFLMGVEVADNDAADLPESDWLALVSAQHRVAQETLSPETLFPEFDREMTDEERAHVEGSSSETGMVIPDQIDDLRFIREQDGVHFAIGTSDNRRVCVIAGGVQDDGTTMGSSGCNAIWYTAMGGTGSFNTGADSPSIMAYLLPPGYNEVVDENGETVAEVTDQLFAMIWESGESSPAELIARGPDGDLHLGLGTSGPSQRETPPGPEAP